jgi:hypothetical protein
MPDPHLISSGSYCRGRLPAVHDLTPVSHPTACMLQICSPVLVLLLCFNTVHAQDGNAASGSTLDPTITGIIAGVGVVVVLGLSFLLWRVLPRSVAKFVCIMSPLTTGLSKGASSCVHTPSVDDSRAQDVVCCIE